MVKTTPKSTPMDKYETQAGMGRAAHPESPSTSHVTSKSKGRALVIVGGEVWAVALDVVLAPLGVGAVGDVKFDQLAHVCPDVQRCPYQSEDDSVQDGGLDDLKHGPLHRYVRRP